MTVPESNGQAFRELQRRTYSVKEAATILGIGRDSAYAAVRIGTLASIRVGRRLVVPHDAIERALAEGQVLVPNADRR